MDNNTMVIALVAIVAIVIVAAMVLMQPAPQTTPTLPQANPQDSPAAQVPGQLSNSTPTEAPQSGGEGAKNTTEPQEQNSPETEGEPEVNLEDAEDFEDIVGEWEYEEEDPEAEPGEGMAFECSFAVAGQYGSADADLQLEGTNMAADGTISIPDLDMTVKAIVHKDIAYLNFPTIKAISSTWYKVPIEDLATLLLTAEELEELEGEDLFEMLYDLGEIEVESDDLSDIEAIVNYVGEVEDLSQEEIDAMMEMIPDSISLSCEFVDDIPDGVFDLPSGANIKEGLPLLVTMYL